MFRSCAAVLSSALCLAGCGGGEGARPNVLVVLVDTLRADRLPFYGYALDTAPFLTSWAARSVVFERAWAASSWTAPATASVFTGVYPDQHGVLIGMQVFQHMQKVEKEIQLNRLPEELETLPEFMRAQGYRTFGAADNPNIDKEIGFDSGFERFQGFDNQGAEHITAKVQEWSAEIRASKPWFVYLHFMDPHSPYEQRAPYYRAPDSGDEHAKSSAAYDSEIRYVDQEVEKVFAALGVGPDTVVVFLADHGEEFGEHGDYGHEPKLYSELTHIPFFVHLPGVAPRRERENVSQVDLLPTLRELLRAPRSEQDAGTSLRGLLEEGRPLGARTLFNMRRDKASDLTGAISGDEKLIVRDYDPAVKKPPARELYDLAADPHEKTNLAAGQATLAAELEARLRARAATARKWNSGGQTYEIAPDLLRKLQELGYGGGEKEDAGGQAPDKPQPPPEHRQEAPGSPGGR